MKWNMIHKRKEKKTKTKTKKNHKLTWKLTTR
jgi:hypothetical protein